MSAHKNEPRSKLITEILAEPSSYIQDGLATLHNSEFMYDKSFVSAYARGIQASGKDYGWHWRVHIGLWAASVAKKIDGDFVECGVNAGFMSSCIMHHLNWNMLNKSFYLLDTFSGLDKRYVTEEEIAKGALERNRNFIDTDFYVIDVEKVKKNFSEWKGVQIIKGSIPETLKFVTSNKIAFLHVDLNCAPPEVASVEYFWEKMNPGAIILLDDYAYWGYREQKIAMDTLMGKLGIPIASLPTGQGLIVKT